MTQFGYRVLSFGEKGRDIGFPLIKNGILHPIFTHTRGSGATYFDKEGIMQTAGTNVPRADYNPVDRSLRGLFFEGTRTNVCLQAEVLTTTWTNPGTNTTITNNAGDAPDGNTTADDVLHGDSAETIQQTITSTDNTVYTISAFVKQGVTGSHDFVKITWLDESTGADGFEAWFNISTGALGTAQVNGTGTYTSGTARIEDIGSGWYRISAAGQIPSGQTDARFEIINTTADAVDTAESTNSVLWWGLQSEIGVHASSYIPTTTTSVTRSADVISATDLTWHNTVTDSYYIEYEKASVDTSLGSEYIWSISTGSTSYTHDLQHQNGTEINPRFNIFEDGTPRADRYIGSIGVDTLYKFGIAAAENDVAASINGGSIFSDTSVTPLPTGLNIVKIGVRANDSGQTNAHIKEFFYWPRRRRDEDLMDISTP